MNLLILRYGHDLKMILGMAQSGLNMSMVL